MSCLEIKSVFIGVFDSSNKCFILLESCGIFW